jgi:glycosyltransferase involved in cell wall biosynthesis
MRITFLLPAWSKSPVGGFKVVYEYANRLSRLGHQVTVVHPLLISGQNLSLIRRFKTVLKRKIYACLKIVGWLKLEWFNVFPDVELLITPDLEEKYIPESDVVIATAWQTAEWVAGYSSTKGKKFYLIQHYEVWSGDKDRVNVTWRMPLKKIVISRWLKEIAHNLGQEATYITNGIDLNHFHITRSIDQRDPGIIGMLYHIYEWKGSKEGIEALQIVRHKFPVRAIFFSTYQPDSDLPDWVDFYKNPPPEKIVEIYNSCSIFMSPSWSEGWSLPPAEAMACGCAVVTTDCGGISEYAEHEINALLSPPRDPQALAQNILRLLEDDHLRVRLARAGHQKIQEFTWEKAVKKLEVTLTEE